MRLNVKEVAATYKYETDEEARKHGQCPETSSTSLHEEDCRDRTEKEGTASDHGHVSGVGRIEPDLTLQKRYSGTQTGFDRNLP